MVEMAEVAVLSIVAAALREEAATAAIPGEVTCGPNRWEQLANVFWNF